MNSPHYVFSLEPAKDFDNIVKYSSRESIAIFVILFDFYFSVKSLTLSTSCFFEQQRQDMYENTNHRAHLNGKDCTANNY